MDELSRKIAKLKRWTHCVGKMDSASTYPCEYWLTGTSKTNVLPAWTTDIAAAWTLWDEMVMAERYPTLHSGPDDNHGGEVVYQVVLVNPYQECPFEDTAPKAISRAWVQWQEAVQQEAK
jgi:hypothetical protein